MTDIRSTLKNHKYVAWGLFILFVLFMIFRWDGVQLLAFAFIGFAVMELGVQNLLCAWFKMKPFEGRIFASFIGAMGIFISVFFPPPFLSLIENIGFCIGLGVYIARSIYKVFRLG